MFQLKIGYSIFFMLIIIQTILSVPIDVHNNSEGCVESQNCGLLLLLSSIKSNNAKPQYVKNPSHSSSVKSNQQFKQLLLKLLLREFSNSERENSNDNNILLVKLLMEMYKYELRELQQNISESNSRLRQLLLQLLAYIRQQQLNVVNSQGTDGNLVQTNKELIALLNELLRRPQTIDTISNQNPVELPRPVIPNVQPEVPRQNPAGNRQNPAGTNKKLVPVVVDLVQDELDLVENTLGDVTKVLI